MALPNEIHPFLVTGNDANQFKVANSLRFRSSNSAYLSRTPTNASNRSTWTWSAWIKRGSLGSQRSLFTSYYASSAYDRFEFTSSDTLRYQHVSSSITYIDVATTAVFRDPSAWYHVVLRMDGSQSSGSRWKVYVNGIQQTFTGTDNTNASLINNNNATYIGYDQQSGTYFDGFLAEVNFIDGQALTPSAFGYTDNLTNQWVPKQYTGTYGTNGFYLPFNSPSLSTNLATAAGTSATAPFGGTVANALTSDSVYLTSNTSTGSSFDFIKYDFGAPTQLTRYQIGALYFTGGTSTFQIQYSNDDVSYTAAASLSVTGSGQNFSGNLNVVARYIKIRPTSFGTNGQANIDLFAVYQDGLGLDSSGNGNNWTPNNISVTSGTTYDVMRDSPTAYDDGGTGRGNYCTLNPLATNSTYSLTNGNLTWSFSSSTLSNYWSRSTFAVGSGKWYWEINVSNEGAGQNLILGIQNATTSAFVSGSGQDVGSGYGYISDGTKITSTSVTAYANAYTANDVVGIALDMDNGAIYFSKNNTWQNSGDPTSGSSKTGAAYTNISGNYNPLIATAIGGGVTRTTSGSVNFGQRPFSYTPPTGFKALNSFNLPNPSLPLV